MRSALSIKDAATPIGKVLNTADPDILSEINELDDLDTYWKILVKKSPELEDYVNEKPALYEAILKSRGDLETDDTDRGAYHGPCKDFSLKYFLATAQNPHVIEYGDFDFAVYQ